MWKNYIILRRKGRNTHLKHAIRSSFSARRLSELEFKIDIYIMLKEPKHKPTNNRNLKTMKLMFHLSAAWIIDFLSKVKKLSNLKKK